MKTCETRAQIWFTHKIASIDDDDNDDYGRGGGDGGGSGSGDDYGCITTSLHSAVVARISVEREKIYG